MTQLLITRPLRDARTLTAPLEAAGIETVVVPTIAIEPPIDGSLERALARAETVAWLIVTSANAAAVLAGRVPPNVRVAAVGPSTASALRGAGIRVHFVPDDYRSAAIAAGLGTLAGHEVLLARSDAATPQLVTALGQAGAYVREAVAYRTVEGPTSSRPLLTGALRTPLDGIVFGSGSAVRGLLALLEPELQERARALPALCIGPVTAAEAVASGFAVDLVAREHTATGLVAAIVRHFSEEAVA